MSKMARNVSRVDEELNAFIEASAGCDQDVEAQVVEKLTPNFGTRNG